MKRSWLFHLLTFSGVDSRCEVYIVEPRPEVGTGPRDFQLTMAFLTIRFL